jgi:hypothetical protein
MQMRSWAVWLSVVGMFVCTSTAWAAPKSKKSKKAKAASSEEAASVKPVEPATPRDPQDVDSLMEDSVKAKSKKKAAAVENDAPEAKEEVGEPDAWERPPADEPKPKKRKAIEAPPEEPKGDGRNMNIGLLAGYALSLGSGLTPLNPYGFGFGLQGDYELENHLVLGVGGEFFIGESDPNTNDTFGNTQAASARYILGHALVGYNVWFGTKMILRPSLWVGTGIALVPASNAILDGVAVNFLLAPGLSFHYLLGDNGWYFGADVRFTVVFGRNKKNGMPLLLTFGKRF